MNAFPTGIIETMTSVVLHGFYATSDLSVYSDRVFELPDLQNLDLFGSRDFWDDWFSCSLHVCLEVLRCSSIPLFQDISYASKEDLIYGSCNSVLNTFLLQHKAALSRKSHWLSRCLMKPAAGCIKHELEKFALQQLSWMYPTSTIAQKVATQRR